MLQYRPSSTLDGGDLGWLKAKHHFVVSASGNPANAPLGALVVWNDDEVAPGTGFALHGHASMEIVTYVRSGTVTHRDSAGNVGETTAGDVQIMSAGKGIRHSEQNLGTSPLRLFQIWLRPRENGGAPSWGNRKFPKEERANQWTVLASGLPEDDEEALPIRAAGRVLGATLHAGRRLEYDLGALRYAYLAPASGIVEVNGRTVRTGDGIAAVDEPKLVVRALEDAEIVLVVTE